MAEKRNTAGRKREVVEMMLSGADRTSLVTDRMKQLYGNGHMRNQEGQSETASPESQAAETLQEEMERTPQESSRVIRTVRRTSERVQRVREVREGRRERLNTEKALSGVATKSLSAGERMKNAAMKQARESVKQAGKNGLELAKNSSTILAKLKQFAVTSVRAISEGIKSGAALIGALGGTTVIVILMICMAAMIFGSAFGIFFTETGDSGERTIKMVMRELEAEYDQTILGLKGTEGYDLLEMHGKPPEWKDVLAVFAVKTNLDPDEPEELITLTKRKERKLRDVYWDMCRISSGVETEKRIVTITVIDKDGKVMEKQVEKEVVVLTIRTTGYSAQEMAGRYWFNREQKELLNWLLVEQNGEYWEMIIA